jgi:tRNA(Ile)-lysidine synthase
VAYSGGRDSTALLFATLKSARQQGVRVAALHVHHGLSPFADDWLAHCEHQCLAWAGKGHAVEFVSRRLNLRVARGESVEAAARDARYAALTEMAREAGATLVLLGQHRRDQAETFLLQALRGAGVAGLAGMPASFDRDGMTWFRPWLTQPREAVEAYLRRHRLRYVDDDSNEDPRYARNRLRLQVWPTLLQAFPDAESVLSDSATWAAEADAVLHEVAQQDLAALKAGQGDAIKLPIQGLQCLSPHRARNVLRFWFKSQAGIAMPASLLERVVSEWRVTGAASWSAPSGTLRCYRGCLRYEAAPTAVAASSATQGEREPSLSIKRGGRYALPGWGGVLQVQRTQEGGVALADAAELRLVSRDGGERFQLALNRPARSLKKQFQAQAVPAWDREGPLLYCGDRLVFVPGLGVDARAWAPTGEPQFSLTWLPNGRE